MNERDMHFHGFAKLLLEELMTKYDHLPPGEWGPAEKDELIIARRAYDLVCHAMSEMMGPACIGLADSVPDLTAWPNTSPEAP